MLIPITIILVLAALSFSGFSKMRTSGDMIRSSRNISQLMVANASYAADHNGKYVPYARSGTAEEVAAGVSYSDQTYWSTNYQFLRNLRGEPIVGHESEVPLTALDPITALAKKDGYTSLMCSYGYNTTNQPGKGKSGTPWPGEGCNQSFSINQVSNPSRTACFITGTDIGVACSNPVLWKTLTNQKEGKTANSMMSFRHANKTKAVAVYYDGHVSTLTVADMEKVNLEGAGNNAFWNASAP